MDRVLLVDDDQRLTAMLRQWLQPRGFTVDVAGTIARGLDRLRDGGIDVLVLDLMLPDGDGLDACRAVRTLDPTLPVLMLTARGDPQDRVVGLEVGADDYLSKPFDPRELHARLRALLRRVRRPARAPERLEFSELVIDRTALSVTRSGQPVPLTAHQFAVLWALASRKGRVLDRAQLSQAVSGGSGDALDRTIDVHISRIRAVLEPDPRRPRYIRTVRGAGYCFTGS